MIKTTGVDFLDKNAASKIINCKDYRNMMYTHPVGELTELS